MKASEFSSTARCFAAGIISAVQCGRFFSVWRNLLARGPALKSIEFCESIGLSYVSCSPFRVPIARLAAAQAALRRTKRYWH